MNTKSLLLQHSRSNTVWIAPERDFAMLAATNVGGDEAAEGTDIAIQVLIKWFEAAFGAGC